MRRGESSTGAHPRVMRFFRYTPAAHPSRLSGDVLLLSNGTPGEQEGEGGKKQRWRGHRTGQLNRVVLLRLQDVKERIYKARLILRLGRKDDGE